MISVGWCNFNSSFVCAFLSLYHYHLMRCKFLELVILSLWDKMSVIHFADGSLGWWGKCVLVAVGYLVESGEWSSFPLMCGDFLAWMIYQLMRMWCWNHSFFLYSDLPDPSHPVPLDLWNWLYPCRKSFYRKYLLSQEVELFPNLGTKLILHLVII